MTNYRKTKLAEYDIEDIAFYGMQRHGIAQARKYQQGLEERFETIADNPMLYQAVDHIMPDYRHSVYGSHTIYYRLDDEGVLIVRILRSQDPFQELADATDQ
jgi:toxin ParE1/3/4